MIPKFRAWNPHKKKMVDDTELVIWGGNIYQGNRQKIFERIVEGKKGLIGYSIDDKYLMQSTGIFGKNDTEIFEGDVVRFSHLSGHLFNGFINRVAWDKHNAAFKLVPLDMTWSDTYFSNFEGDTLKSLEVVGNVYEKDKLEEAINDPK